MAVIELTINPLETPNYVTVGDTQIRVTDLDTETLNELIKEFANNLMDKHLYGCLENPEKVPKNVKIPRGNQKSGMALQDILDTLDAEEYELYYT